jgi:hypothetical protein
MIAVRANVDCDRVDASLNGKLIHSVGRIETPEILRVCVVTSYATRTTHPCAAQQQQYVNQ